MCASVNCKEIQIAKSMDFIFISSMFFVNIFDKLQSASIFIYFFNFSFQLIVYSFVKEFKWVFESFFLGDQEWYLQSNWQQNKVDKWKKFVDLIAMIFYSCHHKHQFEVSTCVQVGFICRKLHFYPKWKKFIAQR